jgi:hypothetical protein
MEESLLSSDSENDDDDEDFTQFNAPSEHKEAAWDEDEVSELHRFEFAKGFPARGIWNLKRVRFLLPLVGGWVGGWVRRLPLLCAVARETRTAQF